MRKILLISTLLALGGACIHAQRLDPPLRPELIADFAEWTPEWIEVKGSTQGFAIYGKYAVVLHDKGQCCIFDLKKKRLTTTFILDGQEGAHCNNACFGPIKTSKKAQFPLLYSSECGGGNACFVSELSLKGSRLLQKIYFDGSGYPGGIDWGLDPENGFLYAYGGINGNFKLIKKFRLPTLQDSDAKGEVHLTDADVLDETRIEDGINIWQGSRMQGKYAFLPDGYSPYARLVHIVDMESKKIVLTKNVEDLADEPEGVDIQGNKLYVVFNTHRQPRRSILYSFSLK